MIAQELRRLCARSPHATYDCCRDCYRLTVLPLGDLDRHVAFTLWEMRPRGWAPILSGHVDDRDELTITFADGPTDSSTLDLLTDFLLKPAPDRSAPALTPVRDVSAVGIEA